MWSAEFVGYLHRNRLLLSANVIKLMGKVRRSGVQRIESFKAAARLQ